LKVVAVGMRWFRMTASARVLHMDGVRGHRVIG
jgi:hypothetical protein